MELYRQHNWQYLNPRIHKINQLSQYYITMGLGPNLGERRIL